ncbi:unnamed protein product [Symbiodinium natans]|uniref:Uncharacterized protein n=1 Tax=Symbiodinium natans TaxID=878477 RepID=A0A812I9B5_9DINO|nr:unnamed protein product [Symbiodinium natans]
MTLIQWPGLSISQDDLADPIPEERAGEVSRTPARRPRPRSADSRQPPAGAPVALKASASATGLSMTYSSSDAVPWTGPDRRGSTRLEPVPEADADLSPRRVERRTPLPLVLLPLSGEQVPPEMLVETVRSSASSGTGQALSAASAGGAPVRGAKLPPELMVTRPAGTAAKDAAPAQDGGRCSRCRELEEEIEKLRASHQEALERERSLWRERLQEAEEEAQRRLRDLESERSQNRAEAVAKLQDAQQKLKVEETRASSAESRLGQVRSEMSEQAEAAERAGAWKMEAQSHAASLSAAERRCEGHAERVARVRRHAAEVERQRKELVRNSSVQASQKLREELEHAQAERHELEKRLKKALPRIERLTAEDHRLSARLLQESEVAAAQAQSLKEEGLEVSRAKDQLQKQRRLARSEADTAEALQAQLAEAEQQRRGAQVELAKSQRLRQEEGKRRQAAFAAEREELRQEVAQLSERLRVAEGSAAGWLTLPSRAQAPLRPQASNISRLTSKQSMVSDRWMDDDTVEAESVATGVASKAVPATDAGIRLFEMIQLAKERSDQRRELTDATEEVREQARALEELLTLEQVPMTRAAYVEAI